MAFPDQGTVIANAIEQSVGLFRAFDVLDAAGNPMVIFTDGIDAEVTEDGRTADDVLATRRRPRFPWLFHPHRRPDAPPAIRRSLGIGGRPHRRQFFQAPTRRPSFVRSRKSIVPPSVESR